MVPTIDAATHTAKNSLSLSQVAILPLGGERYSPDYHLSQGCYLDESVGSGRD